MLPRGGTIAGRVVDRDGKPLANCEVWIYDFWPNRVAKTRTDHEGKYELKGVPGDACSPLSFSARTPTSTVCC